MEVLNSKIQSDSVICLFENTNELTIDNALQFFRINEPEISRNAVILRLNHLVKKGVLTRIGKGLFSNDKRLEYKPVPETDLKKIYKKLTGQFPYTKFCIWNTKLFNEFMIHQPGRFFTIIETERDASEFVFNFLKEFNNEVFLNPDEQIMKLYALNSIKCLIVKDLVSEAPIQNIEEVETITIEKMLVDVFCDNVIFYTQQGSELDNIFVEAFNKYQISRTKLYRYADRRTRKIKINEFIEKLLI